MILIILKARCEKSSWVISTTGRLLLVVFVEHPDHIRIISARPTTTRERKDYEENS